MVLCQVHCSMCPSQWRTSSASWYTVACKVKPRSTWLTSAYQSPTLLLGMQHLRSASRRLLVLPHHRLQTYGRRAFSVAGPSAWNLLPDNLRDPSVTRDSFHRLFKTHLFALYWSIQFIRGFTKMRCTNLLLTYLLTSSKKVTRYLHY